MTRHFKRAFQSAAALLTAGSLLAGVIASAAQYPMGDIDANGNVDTIDALSILIEYVATTVMQKESTMTEQQRTAADINHDGTIDAADALSTLQYYVADNMGNTPEDWGYYEVEDSAATTTTTTEVTTTTTTTAYTYETDTTNNCEDWVEYVRIDGDSVDAVPGQKNVPVTITVDINYYRFSKIELRVSYDPALVPSCTDGKIKYDFGGYFDSPDALVTVESDAAEIVITVESTDGFDFMEGSASFTLYFDIPDDAEPGWRSVLFHVEQLLDSNGAEVPWVDLSYTAIRIVETTVTSEVTTTTTTTITTTTTTTWVTDITGDCCEDD